MSQWGYHMMLNCAKCSHESVRSKHIIRNFTKHLVKDIDMKAYGSPIIKHFGTGNKAGYTLVQLIETSNICAHFCEDTNDIYFDIFSCKPFDPEVAKKIVTLYFSPEHIDSCFMYRTAGVKNELEVQKELK